MNVNSVANVFAKQETYGYKNELILGTNLLNVNSVVSPLA